MEIGFDGVRHFTQRVTTRPGTHLNLDKGCELCDGVKGVSAALQFRVPGGRTDSEFCKQVFKIV